MRAQSQTLYEHSRTDDPDLSEKGVRETLEQGRIFKELGIKIDGIFTSAFVRALKSAHYFREGYNIEGVEKEHIEIKLMLKLHEKGGCQIMGKPKPGISKS